MSPFPAAEPNLIHRAWPFPRPQQDHPIRISQPNVAGGTQPVAGSFIVNGYHDDVSDNTLGEGPVFRVFRNAWQLCREEAGYGME